MNSIAKNIISFVASAAVSTVVNDVVKNNLSTNTNRYHKIMVGLGTFVIGATLSDICADKLVEMVEESMPTTPAYKSKEEREKHVDSFDEFDKAIFYGDLDPDVVTRGKNSARSKLGLEPLSSKDILYNHNVEDAKKVTGAFLIQRYVDTFMTVDNPDIPDSDIFLDLVQSFCDEEHLTRSDYVLLKTRHNSEEDGKTTSRSLIKVELRSKTIMEEVPLDG